MDWIDEGIVLGARALGDANAVLELLTREHGRHLGLVRGGRSRRVRPVLQVGNLVRATWRARLEDHLGGYEVELVRASGSGALDDALALAGIGTIAALSRLLAEREAHARIYDGATLILAHLHDGENWPRQLIFWEIALLEELGVGLDLGACASTGQTHDLVYVSPRSARAVSSAAGAPYADRLLKLPRFLIDDEADASPDDLVAGFRMTGAILERHALGPHGLSLPEPRERLLSLLARSALSDSPDSANPDP